MILRIQITLSIENLKISCLGMLYFIHENYYFNSIIQSNTILYSLSLFPEPEFRYGIMLNFKKSICLQYSHSLCYFVMTTYLITHYKIVILVKI